MIPKTQHRPIAIKIKAAVSPQEVPFRRRYNLKKADWKVLLSLSMWGITDIVPTPDNYGSFVELIKKPSIQNIPSGCRTSYICGIPDESKELYEYYNMKFANDPFNSETTSNRLSDEIAEAQQKKWQPLIQSTDFTHSSRKAWKTINKLSKDYAQLQQQCRVTADQLAHQLLLNGKGNSTHRPSKAKITDNHITKHSLTSPLTMEELMKGITILKNNNNNNNVYLKSNIQTSSMDCTYKPIKYKKYIEYHVKVQVK